LASYGKTSSRLRSGAHPSRAAIHVAMPSRARGCGSSNGTVEIAERPFCANCHGNPPRRVPAGLIDVDSAWGLRVTLGASCGPWQDGIRRYGPRARRLTRSRRARVLPRCGAAVVPAPAARGGRRQQATLDSQCSGSLEFRATEDTGHTGRAPGILPGARHTAANRRHGAVAVTTRRCCSGSIPVRPTRTRRGRVRWQFPRKLHY